MVVNPAGIFDYFSDAVSGHASVPFLLTLGAFGALMFWLMRTLSLQCRIQKSKLHTMSRRLEIAIRATNIGVWELNIDTDELYWDARMCEMYETPQGRVTFENWVQRVHPDDYGSTQEAFDIAVKDRALFDAQYRIVLPSGQVRHVRAMGMLRNDTRNALCMVGANWDISEDVRLNEQLRSANQLSEARNVELEKNKTQIEQLALHDSLTELPNRRYLDKRLAELFANPSVGGGLLHIDLDRFKQINDTMGHAAGDAMLVHAAKVLRSSVRDSDFVARIGGDEFVIVCKAPADSKGLGILAQRILDRMSLPMDFEGQACRCGVSIGIALAEEATKNADQLLVNADIALYRAKNQGRNCFEFYSSELRTAVVQTKRIADQLLSAVEQRAFTPYYQGQFDAETHHISGVEALARWHHPDRGILTPDVFLEVAEDLNVLPAIDLMILEQSLVQMQKWRKAGVKVPKVSVNVSARRLSDPELVEGLKKLSFEPGTLTFELVESTYLDQQSDQVAWNVDQIREAGIDIEVDDFGTGYASIVSLMHLKPKRLKIDRQLILPIPGSPGQRELVRSIVNIGKSLGIDSIAEGVETMEHARILHSLGCTGLQGYALARPMSGAAFATFAREWKPKGVSGQAAA